MSSSIEERQRSELLAREDEDLHCHEKLTDIDPLILHGIHYDDFSTVVEWLKFYEHRNGIAFANLGRLCKLSSANLSNVISLLTDLDLIYYTGNCVALDRCRFFYRMPSFTHYTVYHPYHKFFCKHWRLLR